MATPLVDMSDYEELGCLHDLFITQVQKTPKSIAVVNCDGSKVTFEELDIMSDLLANKLQRLGLQKNSIGGILMERSVEYVVSYLGILKAGAAYLPIEVSWPTSILDSVLIDATPAVICTKQTFSSRVSHSNIPVVYINGYWLQELIKDQKNYPLIPPIKTSLDDKAYVVYSSGTTGKPKGIECPHRGAVFSYTWRHRAYPYKDDDKEACNIFFVWEMLRPLAKGIPMYIIPDDVIYDPPKLADFIEKNKITRMLFTPSLLQAMLEYKGINLPLRFKSLRQIVYCGEVLTTALKEEVASRMPWIVQLNLYSISECHDVASADLTNSRKDSDRQFCSVGKLFPGVHAVIMDQDLNIKSVGEPGEIFIGGPCLAHGYLKRPELNKLRFISRPSHVNPSVGDRLYRTGDWGYVLSDGSLEVCGRCDTMVKIRGYSIDLEAVRINILELPGVIDVCVRAFGKEGEDKSLVAFVVRQENILSSTRELRKKLKKKLPFYMIPSRFIELRRLPVVELSGKLDVKRLASIYEEVENQAGNLEVVKIINEKEELVTETEMKIAKIWSELLCVHVLDTDESFFELGGHSLLAATLSSRLNEQFVISLSTSHVFQNPTISSLASLITMSVTPLDEKINFKTELDKLTISFNGVDSQIRSYWQTVQTNPNKFSTGNVLLTGATGYVGCFLLQELLLHTQTTVYCLVRETPNMTLLERLQQARHQFGLRKFLPTERVIPLKGDVSLINLGLSKDMYKALSLEVDVVIHAAAQVNLILPYSALYNSNVLGTFNVITFAVTGKIKHIHHISSSAVFPVGVDDVKEGADMSQYCEGLHSGYGQTKWVSEQLIQMAANRGCPTTIYRCGNVGGSRLSSGWNPADFNLHMLKGVFKTGLFSEIGSWQIEFTPVDFLSQVIIHLVKNVHESVNKVFHLVNSNSYDWQKLWSLLADLGYSISKVSYSEWKTQVKEKGKVDAQLAQLYHLLDGSAMEEEFSTKVSTYNQENVNKVLKKMNLVYPSLSEDLMKWYIENLSSIGLIPRSQQKRDRSRSVLLKSKVVLVTGASSGIGEGIARILAAAGATVVLAARRLDRLTKIAQELKEGGAEAIPVKLDVCNEQEVSSCVKKIEATVGPIDVLVNNAGVMYYQMIMKCDIARWNQMVSVNINGTLNCLAAVIDRMVARGSGHIVNISSDGARKPFPGLAVYCGTKYFIRCLSGAMRSELASSGIKVTDIQPGDVESELHNVVTDPEAEGMYDWSTKVPILKPSEVGEAVLYALCQPSNCAINEILLEPQLLPL